MSLRIRLFSMMITVAAVTAGTVALFARQTTVDEFQRYVMLNDERNQRLGNLFTQASELQDAAPAAQATAVALLAADLGERVILADQAGLIIADSAGSDVGHSLGGNGLEGAVVVQFAPAAAAPAGTISFSAAPLPLARPPVGLDGETHDLFLFSGQTTATVARLPADQIRFAATPLVISWSAQLSTDPIQAGFISGVNRWLAMALLVAGLTAVALTWLMARGIIGPVEALTAAARRMEQGDLGQRVAVRSRDEIAQLAGAFNAMAAGLGRAESLRRHMVADLAHELRTPLTNIRGYLEALRDGVATPDPATLESLHEEALLLNHLIDDLQDLALAEAGQLRLRRRPTDLATQVARVAGALGPRLAERGVACHCELPADLPALDADPDRLGQVLRNLLDNALTHTPAGGTITVAAVQAGPLVEVSVRDTGSGIPAADLPNIFERFYRADPSRSRRTGGAGLGLTIVRQLVEAHGGQVWAASTPGAGTTIRFTIRGVSAASGKLGQLPGSCKLPGS